MMEKFLIYNISKLSMKSNDFGASVHFAKYLSPLRRMLKQTSRKLFVPF